MVQIRFVPAFGSGSDYEIDLSSTGILKLKVLPIPFWLFDAQILPPCASTMFFEMYSPKPVPLSDFEINFSNR